MFVEINIPHLPGEDEGGTGYLVNRFWLGENFKDSLRVY